MAQSWQFGTRTDGRPITAFTLVSDAGFEAVILDQGAILQSFRLPNSRNVTLGFETWEDYETDPHYTGRIIGPNANRILDAQFRIDGDAFKLFANDGPRNLHSAPNGFDVQMWSAKLTKHGLTLELEWNDKDNRFPGEIRAKLTISLKANRLRLKLQATADRATPMNLTWHPYWNLGGGGRIDGHDLYVEAESRTPLLTRDARLIKDTRYDFQRARPLGSVRLDANYSDVDSARLTAGQTAMTVRSSLPDMQVYTGDALADPRSGIALEPQYRPNDINFAQDCLLRPGEVYDHWVEYSFNVT